MRNFLKMRKCLHLWERLNYFVYLLHVVKHLWKLQCYHAISVGYGPACLKFFEITNRQYLWKGFNDFVDFLHVVIGILLDIHWSYKNLLLWVGTVRRRLSVNQIVRGFKLQSWGIKLIFWHRWSYRKYAILDHGLKKLLANQLAEIFTFDLFDLLILIPGVHCYIVLVFFILQVYYSVYWMQKVTLACFSIFEKQ